MYQSFHIENYKGFRRLDLTDISRINLIAGRNNIGKTSLLEAFMVHMERYNIIFDRVRKNNSLDFDSLFYAFDNAAARLPTKRGI